MLNRLVNSFYRAPLPSRFIATHKLLYEPCSNLYLVCCEFNQNYFDVNLFKKHSITLPNCFRNYPVKRQSEYLAGRYAAKLALSVIDGGIWSEQVKIGNRKVMWFR